MRKREKRRILILMVIVVILTFFPLFLQRNAEFKGSDDAGSVQIEEMKQGYVPWFTPVAEQILGRELPGELENLLFCIQTGIGVGIIAFLFGRMTERKKWMDRMQEKKGDGEDVSH